MISKDTNIGRIRLEHSSGIKTASKKNNETPDFDEASKVSEGLAKVASYPYSESTYTSVQEIMKIASERIGQLVDSLKSTIAKASELEKAAEVRILLDDMINNGSIDEMDIKEKVAKLMNKTPRELEIIKAASEMIDSGREGNIFFELEKNASVPGKRDMFSGVVD